MPIPFKALGKKNIFRVSARELNLKDFLILIFSSEKEKPLAPSF